MHVHPLLQLDLISSCDSTAIGFKQDYFCFHVLFCPIVSQVTKIMFYPSNIISYTVAPMKTFKLHMLYEIY